MANSYAAMRGIRSFYVLLFVCAGFLFTCSRSDLSSQRPLRIALRSIVNSLDPLSENTVNGGNIYLNLYDALVSRDQSLSIHPCLATRWSTPDDRTWIFELRKGARFSDGSPITVSDVKFSLERVMKAAGVQQSSGLAMLEHVQILSDHALKLVTKHPSSTLLVRLADVSIVPAGKVSEKGLIPGSGPYYVSDWTPGRYVLLKANPYYWLPKPHVTNAEFRLYTSISEATKAFLNRDLDMLPQIDPQVIEDFHLIKQKDVVIHNDPGLLVIYLAFGLRPDHPASKIFSDIRVRQAVASAINVDRLITDVQKGYADPATQLVAPIVYGFNNHLKRVPYDPEKAKQLLSEAGYKNGFEIRFDITNNRYHRDVETGRSIATDLNAVGIRTTVDAKPLKEWLELRRKGETSFYLAGWVVGSGDSSGALDYLLHTPSSQTGYGAANNGGYSNPALDALIEQCGQMMDPKARLKMLEDSMRIAMEDFAVVPLYVEKNLTVTRSEFVWEPYPDQLIRLDAIKQYR